MRKLLNQSLVAKEDRTMLSHQSLVLGFSHTVLTTGVSAIDDASDSLKVKTRYSFTKKHSPPSKPHSPAA